MKKNIALSRRLKHGTMATVITVVFIALVVLFNVVFSLVLQRFPAEVDLTDNNMYQLTQESVDYVKTVEDDVHIIVCGESETFDKAGTMYRQVNEIIQKYDKYSDNISLEYVNLVENPEIANKYAAYNVGSYSIIVESAKRVKVLSLDDLFSSNTDQTTGQTTYSSKAEQAMTSAVMYVTDDALMQVNVLTGHSESAAPGLVDMLTKNNYEVVERNISTEGIDPNATVVIMAAPTTDYTEEELKRVDEFLSNGGNLGKTLIYIGSTGQEANTLPNLDAFLAEWGIEIGDGIIYETNMANAYGQYYVMSAEYTAKEYTEELRQPDLPFISYASRPVYATFEEATNGRTTTTLLSTPDTTVLVPFDAAEDFDLSAQEQQAFPLAVMGQMTVSTTAASSSSTVLAFGSMSTFDSGLLGSASYNNNEYTIHLINSLTGKQGGIEIVDVSFDTQSLDITEAEFRVYMIVTMFIIPIVMIVLGVVVWLRRRNK